ncbi:hypothetical protein IV203_028401 [Nitzschia inconspicua]|uniref:Uncharacterized protein n=1 Tax=Nitzschia inconspicua TaxID=303405 RepID=A0A9K3KX92_9STRA|nr:hypothetical protein IV203_007680 [Nitzschia inconspicua]KAG7365731.1 hypothetical protein IV203_028401 [Nitzschia inconspicua]
MLKTNRSSTNFLLKTPSDQPCSNGHNDSFYEDLNDFRLDDHVHVTEGQWDLIGTVVLNKGKSLLVDFKSPSKSFHWRPMVMLLPWILTPHLSRPLILVRKKYSMIA